jgi:hypothetical protein
MFEKLKNWFSKGTDRQSPAESPAMRETGSHKAPHPKAAPAKVPRPNPEFVESDEDLSGKVESAGPGKNVLIRNKYVREDTGTHETLKILDDSMVDSGEETGFDPYNTGGFDRSKNWDKRFGK